jgi:hypothetical protein
LDSFSARYEALVTRSSLLFVANDSQYFIWRRQDGEIFDIVSPTIVRRRVLALRLNQIDGAPKGE